MHGGIEELSVDRFCCDISAAGGNVVDGVIHQHNDVNRVTRGAGDCARRTRASAGVWNHERGPRCDLQGVLDGLVSDVGDGQVCFERGQCRRCEPDGWHGDEHVLPPLRGSSRRPHIRCECQCECRCEADQGAGLVRQDPLRPDLDP